MVTTCTFRQLLNNVDNLRAMARIVGNIGSLTIDTATLSRPLSVTSSSPASPHRSDEMYTSDCDDYDDFGHHHPPPSAL